MPHVIVDACTKDFACVDSCPTGCILPTADDQRIAEVPSCTLTRKSASTAVLA
jgi:Na+-translocating ferredoxin:NAD+ oxidoreductase RNF subunit RnfB